MTWQRVGIQTQDSGAGEFLPLASVAGCVKGVGDVGALIKARSVNPNCFTVYRPGIEQEDQDNWTPEQWFNRCINDCWGFKPNAFEYKNEWKQYLNQGLDQRIQEEHIFAKLCHDYGVLFIGGSLSVGSSEKEDILYYMQHGWGGMDLLGVHCYWQKNKPQDRWTAEWYLDIHEWTGGIHPPIAITEWGIDDIDQMGAGWLAQDINGEDYTKQLDTNAKRLPWYISWAFIFGHCMLPRWKDFDTRGITSALISGIHDDTVPETPTPTNGGGNVEQYEFKLAFAGYAAQHPEIGKATSDISYYHNTNPEGHQLITQWCEKGKLEYNEGAEVVGFFPFA